MDIKIDPNRDDVIRVGGYLVYRDQWRRTGFAEGFPIECTYHVLEPFKNKRVVFAMLIDGEHESIAWIDIERNQTEPSPIHYIQSGSNPFWKPEQRMSKEE